MRGDGPTALVVGAGVLGSAIAQALAGRGWAVTIVEQYAPANRRSSSYDSSRLFRVAHGNEDPSGWYTNSAWRARERWRQIGEEEQVELLCETGLVWFARRDDGFEALSEQRLTEVGVPFRRLPPAAARDLYP